MYDLVNLAQNITVPVVSVSIKSVTRDENRVFNKISGYYYSKGISDTTGQPSSTHYNSPVPVNITVAMSIMTKFQTDMDQIISNFVPYNNPYIVISWKVPEDLVSGGFAIPQEIRSEVLWDGTVSLNYPTDINASEKYKIIGDTSFTIKGWLFPAAQDDVGNIFYITENFHAVNMVTSVSQLSAETYVYPVSSGVLSDLEVVSLSAFPQITNVFYNTPSFNIPTYLPASH
jgi:T4-like virus Myoviridae tail sheath stabiliser